MKNIGINIKQHQRRHRGSIVAKRHRMAKNGISMYGSVGIMWRGSAASLARRVKSSGSNRINGGMRKWRQRSDSSKARIMAALYQRKWRNGGAEKHQWRNGGIENISAKHHGAGQRQPSKKQRMAMNSMASTPARAAHGSEENISIRSMAATRAPARMAGVSSMAARISSMAHLRVARIALWHQKRCNSAHQRGYQNFSSGGIHARKKRGCLYDWHGRLNSVALWRAALPSNAWQHALAAAAWQRSAS